MNRVTLIGNLGTDPKAFEKNGEVTMVVFRLATTQKYKGEEKTQWHNIKILDKVKASVANQHLAKGSKVAVTGQLEYRDYEKDGATVNVAEIVLGFGSDLEILTWQKDPKPGGGESRPADTPF